MKTFHAEKITSAVRYLPLGIPASKKTDFIKNTSNRSGGAIFNEGEMSVTGCSFDQNTSKRGGGALGNRGEFIVRNCRFAKNTAIMGGAIGNENQLAVIKSTFTENLSAMSAEQ